MKKILKNPEDFSLVGKLWIYGKDDRFMGPGRVELLEKIQETGSINKAAKLMQMSYKKAWEMVNSMNAQTIKPLVITQTGGKEGGGTIVTEEGKQVMTFFKDLHQHFNEYLALQTNKIMED